MDKQQILAEIVRTAKSNGGTPLGWRRFSTETGINHADWFGKHWPRWSDAVLEAGCTPNQMREAYDDNDLLEAVARLILEIGRYPAIGDFRMRTRRSPGFPADTTFRRLGTSIEIAAKVAKKYRDKAEFEEAVRICDKFAAVEIRKEDGELGEESPSSVNIGDVYLIKSGRNYKIGHSNAAGRREREIALQLPDKVGIVHVIKTDDPRGIEEYWHRRFAEKRKNGEWFDLDRADVATFRRRKTM